MALINTRLSSILGSVGNQPIGDLHRRICMEVYMKGLPVCREDCALSLPHCMLSSATPLISP